MADGERYSTDRRTGLVQVDDRHVADVRSHYGAIGLIDVRQPTTLGTKGTRWCWECNPAGQRLQAWTNLCPFCGAPTSIGDET